MTQGISPITRPPRPRWQRWAVDALFFAALFTAIQYWLTREAVLGPAPTVAGQLTDSRDFDLGAWRAAYADRASLIYFWADWCPICQTTAGNVTDLAKDWPVISIASQSGNAAAVIAFMQTRDYRWPTLPDPSGDLMKRFGLQGVPAFVILDPQGNIRFVTTGYTSEIGLRLRLWWASRGTS